MQLRFAQIVIENCITDNCVRESQRDSNPSAQGWRAATTLGNRSPNSSTLKELNERAPFEIIICDFKIQEVVTNCDHLSYHLRFSSRFEIGCIAEADLLRQWHIGFPS
jgi:hypothetical protein